MQYKSYYLFEKLLTKWRRTLKCRLDAKQARTKKDLRIQELEKSQKLQEIQHIIQISNLKIQLKNASNEIEELKTLSQQTKTVQNHFHQFFSILGGIQQMYQIMADLKTQFESTVDNISAGFEIASMGPKNTQVPNQDEPLNLCLKNQIK